MSERDETYTHYNSKVDQLVIAAAVGCPFGFIVLLWSDSPRIGFGALMFVFGALVLFQRVRADGGVK